jgi:UDP-N-acetylglucosamine 2-epimerase (non-hydrolysing)
MVLFGTRPEAIKLAPVISELKKSKEFKTIVCSTGQHREMLKQVLDLFKIKIDIDLDLMLPNQDLFDISVNSLTKLKNCYKDIEPDCIIVQGDTSTAFIASLGAFYLKIKVAHVEAGLRSYNIFSPYPEEANRRFISVVTNYHFVPTKDACQNLLSEGYSKKNVWVTGNTVIDALLTVDKLFKKPRLNRIILKSLESLLDLKTLEGKFVLITMHRREKFGKEFEKILKTVKYLASLYPDYKFIYPVHLNPNVQNPVNRVLGSLKNVILLPPLDYLKFTYLMSKCELIISDSGGVQEECYVFKKPIIVTRDVTERNEAIRAGYAFLVGSDQQKILSIFNKIVKNKSINFNYFTKPNPFGNGTASQTIVKILEQQLTEK